MFWIYVNKGKATLHRGACVDCNDGTGKTGSVDSSGKWQGPFELLEDAKPEKGEDIRPCRKCHPNIDW